jgi:rRNA maturation protein Nop10
VKFWYQLKAITGRGWHDTHLLYAGYVEAENKKEAKAKMEDEFQMKLKERIVAKEGAPLPEYKLHLVPTESYYEEHFLPERTCTVCGERYTILIQRNLGIYASKDTCSPECRVHNRPKVPEYFDSLDGYKKPVIYRISNKNTGLSYIGKTKQPFTLRWWQHFFHPTTTKFHLEIQKSQVEDWTFEIVETLAKEATDQHIAAREQFWINFYDSLNYGYNSTSAMTEPEPDNQLSLGGEYEK